jgi:hypothetical protein
MRLASAGVRGGQSIGATDEPDLRAEEVRFHVSDLHATILRLLGFDQERLTYPHLGLDQRLTGVASELTPDTPKHRVRRVGRWGRSRQAAMRTDVRPNRSAQRPSCVRACRCGLLVR